MGNLVTSFGRLIASVNHMPHDAAEAGARLARAIRGIVNPILIVVGTMGALLAIWLGVRLALAQDESKRKEAKAQLIFALIAVIIIFAIVGVMYAVFPDQGTGGTGVAFPY